MARGRLWLVTGGAGFIGSHLARALVEKGERVRVLDNLSSGKLEFLAPIRDRVELVKGDIRSFGDCRRAARGARYVLHHAAIRAVSQSVERPEVTHEVNATGTLNVLRAAREAGVRRVVYASSSAAYGDAAKFPISEKHLPRPLSPYACQKLLGEHYAITFAKTYGLETVSLRYFNVFGPRQDPESLYSAVIPKFMEQAYEGRPLEVHWDGRQERDFTHVSDIVRANLAAAVSREGVGEAFNIASGRACSLLQLIAAIERIVGCKLERRHAPKRAGDVRRSRADISRARRVLGYAPQVRLEDGLRDTWEYFVSAYFAKQK